MPLKHRISAYYGLKSDSVSFSGKQELTPEEKFKTASENAKKLCSNEIHYMSEVNQKKLEGIQYGLKSFEGVTFPEIYFLLSHTRSLIFPLYRDCPGRCGPCYLNGHPAERSNPNLIRRVDFEDFKNFTDDFKEITKRLDFDFNHTCRMKKDNPEPSALLFHDSDSKDTWLTDKNGTVHYFPELNKMMHEATGLKGLFDTAGWSPRDTITQKRMEAAAKYYSEPQHFDEIKQINISFNPYHGLLIDANEKKANGDIEGFERQRNNYVKNIANAMYTMTPLLRTEKYFVFRKCVDDNESDEFNDYKKDAFLEIQEKVLKELENRYREDLNNNVTKFVKTEDDIQRLINLQKSCFTNIKKRILPNAHNKLFSKITKPAYNFVKDNKNAGFDDAVYPTKTALIDMNGKVFFVNAVETFETDIQLNFNNKEKDSKELNPKPDKRILRIKEQSFY